MYIFCSNLIYNIFRPNILELKLKNVTIKGIKKFA